MSLEGVFEVSKAHTQAQSFVLCLLTASQDVGLSYCSSAMPTAMPLCDDNGQPSETVSKTPVTCFLKNRLPWSRCFFTSTEQWLRHQLSMVFDLTLAKTLAFSTVLIR